MREKVGMLEATTTHKHNRRIPTKINTFKQFTQRKSTYVREAALTIELEMYWLDMDG